MYPSQPCPGDLITVQTSEWYALPSGEKLRVCEQPGWAIAGRDIYVAPRRQVRTFWGPQWGPPSPEKPSYMSTSGGPFKTITLSLLNGLRFTGSCLDDFWHWRDWPCAGGGIDYQVSVRLWLLPHLPDRSWLDPDLSLM